MPQQCRVCIHPQRVLIDAELTSDWERGLRAIGLEYGLSKDSIARHAQNHLPNVEEDSPGETSSAGFGQKNSDELLRMKNGATAPTSQDLAVKSAAETRHEKKDETESSVQEKSNPWANWERK